MKNNNDPLRNYARYSGIAVQMLVIIAGGIIGGFYLDRWLQWNFPVFTVLFSILSVGIAIYISIKDFLKK